jgi:hypothetical protein
VRRALLAIALVACSNPKPEQRSVDVFAEDTVSVRFTITTSGTLQMRVNAEGYFVRPDRSIVFVTPATLFATRGAGTSILTALDSTQRLAVQPRGVSPDSAERAAVVGRVVRVTRAEQGSGLAIEPAKPD